MASLGSQLQVSEATIQVVYGVSFETIHNLHKVAHQDEV